jgi:hypothetical protein
LRALVAAREHVGMEVACCSQFTASEQVVRSLMATRAPSD